MQTIQPLSLGMMRKPYTFLGRHYLVVTAFGFFHLGKDNPRFMPEFKGWPEVFASFSATQAIDEGMIKAHAEVLLAGQAHAPGAPCSQLPVQLNLFDAKGASLIQKTLCVSGDRDWQANSLGLRSVDQPKPFAHMPLTYSRAFGGPQYDLNPVGCAASPRWFGARQGKMPNISYPATAGKIARKAAAGFGPIPIGQTPRKQKWGSYGKDWLKNEAPGFAHDIDWSLFNLAPADQWASDFFKGGERYCLVNLHPKQPQLQGQVPDFAARAFILKDKTAPQNALEVPMRLDTLWFLPESDLGVAIYHGQIEIDDSDAQDVQVLLLAYEHASQPKPLAHYQQVLALRLSKASAQRHVFNDSQLAPERSPEELARRAAVQAKAEQDALAKSQKRIDLLDAQYWAKRGTPAPAGHQPPKATIPPLGLMSEEAAKECDFDLSDIMDKAAALCAKAEADGKARLAQLPPKLSPNQPRPVDANQQLAKALEKAAIPAYDLQGEAGAGCDPGLAHQLALAEHKLESGQMSVEEYAKQRASIAKLPGLKRQGRRAAPKIMQSGLPLLPEVAQQLGEQVRQWQQGGVLLAGRDLAGADLRGIDWRGADLREILLEGADLRGANLQGANLQGAALTGALLDRANFSHANLSQANFSTSSGSHIDFSHANLSQAQLIDASWPSANLHAANLQRLLAIRVDWQHANLCEVNAFKAILVEVQAKHSQWQRASLEKTTLLRANLQQADLRGVRTFKNVFTELQLQGSCWDGADLNHVQSGGANDWSGASLANVKAQKCGFRNAVLTGVRMQGAQFLRCDFGLAQLQAAHMQQALFAWCLFYRSNLREADASAAEFFQGMCRKADFSDALLLDAKFAQCDLSESIPVSGAKDGKGGGVDKASARRAA